MHESRRVHPIAIDNLTRRLRDPRRSAYGNSLMKLVSLILLLATTCISIAQEPHAPPGTEVPRHYKKFQGEWVVVSQSDSPGKDETSSELLVTITGQRIVAKGPGVSKDLPQPLEFTIPKTAEENPYRELRKLGAKKLDKIVDVENQITVFWFVGIYKLQDDELQLALKYCGQGLEGQHFRDFVPPSSFDEKQMEDEVRVTLRRKKK